MLMSEAACTQIAILVESARAHAAMRRKQFELRTLRVKGLPKPLRRIACKLYVRALHTRMLCVPACARGPEIKLIRRKCPARIDENRLKYKAR